MRTASKSHFWLALVPALALFFSASSAHAAVDLPGGKKLETVDFERHIMGLLGRTGCNGGGCHGSFQGKGGFRLSLFGYEPAKDFWAITRDSLARRINPVDPDNSLLLLKATGQVEHGGAMRFGKDTWQYNIIREWIAQGAPWSPGSGDVVSVTVSPKELAFKKPRETQTLRVTVRFSDGSDHDITPFCDFRTNDDAVADVSNLGVVRSVRAGSTAIIVSYRGNVVPVPTLVPMDLPVGFKYPQTPEVNYVDREVFARLKKLNMVPSDLSSDEDFLRRITIDTIGQLPTPEEVRAFVKDTRPDKRTRKIDELLAHPLHAALWATKFSDITGNDTQSLQNPVQLKAKRSQQWHDWLRKRFQDNMPYDQLVKGILTATSRQNMSPEQWLDELKKTEAGIDGAGRFDTTEYAKRETLDLYWRRQQNIPIEIWGERTAAAFLGVRVECAQCHKHPFDRWTQAEYRAYANIFASVNVGISPEARAVINKENNARKGQKKKNNAQLNLIKEVYFGTIGKTFTHPDTNARLPAKALGGPEIELKRGEDARVELFNWMRSPDNPFFARALVNRIWAHYTGVGLVHPVDDFSLGNPPSNDVLLNALAKDFIDHKFDFRHIERVVLTSRTYQLSARVNETNRFDTRNYAHAYIRPMIAEAVVDVLNSALGTTEKYGQDVKAGLKSVEVGASQMQNQTLAYTFRIFGRPPRTTACDCERAMEPALPQKLFLMTDPNLLAKFNDPKGRVQTLIKSGKTDEECLEELFLATLSRMPTAKDRQSFADHRRLVGSRREALIDTMWALINTREFILNH
ncbi:MAG: DUF1549 domain-containing protein [Planctomycetes bacterium]|nr:DUF1549 domain-containing protein [Planctomycetota bacterium]